MYRRRRSRARRRAGGWLPLCAGLLALFAFIMAFSAPSGTGEPRRGWTARVRPSSETEPGQDHAPQGVEPSIPPEEDGWPLLLVNAGHPLSRDYAFPVTELKNGQSVDQRCYPDLQEMMDDCRAAGLSPVICSSYRSYEKQEELYRNKVDRLVAQGYARSGAETEAAREVALPGTSEHQLGLALDIVDLNNQNLDETQEDTAVQKWLMEHSWEYGFVLRYPTGKSDVTGIIYEPWHYRYVGREAAAEMVERGVCLEEYVGEGI